MQFINVMCTKSTNISFNNFDFFRIMLGKDNISLRWNNIWFFLLFEDKGRLHAHHNRIKRGLLPGQSLSSELERDCRRQESSREFRYSWLGLFNCWIGHNYPVLSSPPHAPRSGAHWPNRMEYFTPSPLETKLYRLFDEQSVLQEVAYWTMIQYFFKNISF